MDAQTQSMESEGDGRAGGLKDVAHVIAVSSCKARPCFLRMYPPITPP